jgi:porin
VRIRAGYLDQQTVLDRNAFANSEDRQFMSTFLDNNPVVPLKIGPGAALFVAPTEWLEVVLATADADNDPRHTGLDTAFDGASSLNGYLEARARYHLNGERGVLPGTLRVGAFLDGSRKKVFGSVGGDGKPKRERGHGGIYLGLDQLVYREGSEDTQGLGVFARYGYADPDVNRIEHFWSIGLQYEGLVCGRDRDVLGLGTYQAIGSHRYRDEVEPDFDEETGLELYYKIALAPWLEVTPDAQLILDPGALRSERDAVVVLLRFRATF